MGPSPANALELRAQVERYPWYQTLDLGNGVVTNGMFDHRPVLERYPLPEDLTGLRCLDVGTMDGFWAFEMERRGAESVTALDLEDPEDLDSCGGWSMACKAARRRPRFRLAGGDCGALGALGDTAD